MIEGSTGVKTLLPQLWDPGAFSPFRGASRPNCENSAARPGPPRLCHARHDYGRAERAWLIAGRRFFP